MPLPTRDEAWELVCEWIASDSLRRHVLAVEAGVRAMRGASAATRRCGASPRCCTTSTSSAIPIWTIPRRPPRAALRYFREHDFPPELIQAVAGHAPYLGIPRTTMLDSTLWATDELTGLIMAVAYVRPARTSATSRSAR